MFLATLIGIAVMGQAQSTTTNDFPALGPLPTTIVLHDSRFGDCPLTYTPINPTTKTGGWWSGSKLVNYAATPLCPAASNVPIFYTLVGSTTTTRWSMTVQFWATTSIPAGNNCPCQPGGTQPRFQSPPRLLTSWPVGSTTVPVNPAGATTWTFGAGNQGTIFGPAGANLVINLPAGN